MCCACLVCWWAVGWTYRSWCLKQHFTFSKSKFKQKPIKVKKNNSTLNMKSVESRDRKMLSFEMKHYSNLISCKSFSPPSFSKCIWEHDKKQSNSVLLLYCNGIMKSSYPQAFIRCNLKLVWSSTSNGGLNALTHWHAHIL